MNKSRLPLVLALNNVRSLHNVGALFRTADALGVEMLILGGITPTPPRDEMTKTALGALETVPWVYAANLVYTLSDYEKRGYAIRPLEITPTAVSLYETRLSVPSVIVCGHERLGIEADILTRFPHHLALPMRGASAHSLNVSTALAVAGYEFLRQYESTSE